MNLPLKKPKKAFRESRGQSASILVALLWCVALLAVIVIGVLHASTLDLRIVKNHGDQIQAHYLALAGVEKTRALLFHDARERSRSANDHTGELFDAPHHFQDVPLGRGQFRVIREGRPDEAGQIIYGISDEESRLNVNHASAEELAKLPELLPENAAAILDYRDPDHTVTPGGAEAEDYLALQPPYLPRNAPLRTPRELLMVYGIDRELFLGADAKQNGMPKEQLANRSGARGAREQFMESGWSAWVTVDSAVRNVTASGQERVNIQSADESTLGAVPGISADLAKAIVAYRNQNQFESVADLLDVAPVRRDEEGASQPQSGPQPPGTPRPQTGPRDSSAPQAQSRPQPGSAVAPGGPTGGRPIASGPRPAGGGGSPGQKLISQDLFLEIAGDLTAKDEQDRPGAVNINTAEATVLTCLPGITEELARAIISYRQSSGYFSDVAWLLRVPGMNQQLLKQIAPRVSTRSETFRILSEGLIPSTGARKRLLVTVRVGTYDIETLSFREDDL